jgi:solute carrier family 25 protein 33/36
VSGAVLTSPLDVVKTRLQSDMFKHMQAVPVSLSLAGTSTPIATARPTGVGGILWNFVETTHIIRYFELLPARWDYELRNWIVTPYLIRDIYKYEGFTALFKGLGPSLAGTVPARSINFFVYGNGKQIIADNFNHGEETSFVHFSAAALAGE